MKNRLAILTILAMSICAPAKAERQIYNPYTLGVTHQELDRAKALQQRQALLGTAGTSQRGYRNTNRRISPVEQYQVLTIEEEFKKRFPVHPGLYRDAYDRGTFRRSTTGGNNPRD